MTSADVVVGFGGDRPRSSITEVKYPGCIATINVIPRKIWVRFQCYTDICGCFAATSSRLKKTPGRRGAKSPWADFGRVVSSTNIVGYLRVAMIARIRTTQCIEACCYTVTRHTGTRNQELVAYTHIGL